MNGALAMCHACWQTIDNGRLYSCQGEPPLKSQSHCHTTLSHKHPMHLWLCARRPWAHLPSQHHTIVTHLTHLWHDDSGLHTRQVELPVEGQPPLSRAGVRQRVLLQCVSDGGLA